MLHVPENGIKPVGGATTLAVGGAPKLAVKLAAGGAGNARGGRACTAGPSHENCGGGVYVGGGGTCTGRTAAGGATVMPCGTAGGGRTINVVPLSS